MKKLFYLIPILLLSVHLTFGQKVSGKIIYDSGFDKVVEFSSIEKIGSAIPPLNYQLRSKFLCEYVGAVRELPFSKLKSITIEDFKIYKSAGLYYAKDIDVRVLTVDGRSFNTTFSVFDQIVVNAYDHLTDTTCIHPVGIFSQGCERRDVMLFVKEIIFNNK